MKTVATDTICAEDMPLVLGDRKFYYAEITVNGIIPDGLHINEINVREHWAKGSMRGDNGDFMGLDGKLIPGKMCGEIGVFGKDGTDLRDACTSN